MKEFRFRFILILAAIALCIYLLYPTYQDYQNNKEINSVLDQKREELKADNPDFTRIQIDRAVRIIEDSIKQADPSIMAARMKRIKLGLDLQGGMRVVLEVNTGKLLEKLANNPDQVFQSVLAEAQMESDRTDESIVEVMGRKFNERGIRLSRYFGSIRMEDSEILEQLEDDATDAVARAMEIIRNRVDQYGVSEPSIQRQGSRRIIVELPGVAREEEAKQLIQGTALLEFRLVKDPEFTIPILESIDRVLAARLTGTEKDTLLPEQAETDTTALADDTTTAADTTQEQLTEEEFRKQHPFFSVALLDQQGRYADLYVSEENRSLVNNWLSLPEVQRVIPDNVEFVYSAKPIGTQEGRGVYVLHLVNKAPELTGGVITDARAEIDPNTSAWMVTMGMSSEGATDWARITGANVNKRIAIMLDGVVFSAPNVRNRITGGRSQIEGMAGQEEAKLLEIVLKAGALPAPVDVIEERVVGPSLGQDSVSSGFNSALIGFFLVAVFMIFYYRKAGTVAAGVLVFTVLFILGVLAGFSATLTLPGIAGIILTIGMAVDANVLIFERIREELATGKTVKASVDSGYEKALSAIIDSNITTFFTGIILYQFGTGPVQGFALTLMIGIASTLFSALVVSRLVFDYMAAKGMKITVG
ncbi:MAG: protein translocase subunit SecD [Ignavibacteriaceae bacterium]